MLYLLSIRERLRLGWNRAILMSVGRNHFAVINGDDCSCPEMSPFRFPRMSAVMAVNGTLP
jgi:hypothetical protein